MSQPVDAKYQSKELNLYSNDGKNKYTFSDATGLVPGLAATSPILKLEGDVSAAGYRGSVAIPNLLYKIHGTEYYGFLSTTISTHESNISMLVGQVYQEGVDRKAADATLTSGLAAEVKARGDADTIHTGAIAQEVFDRGSGDFANLTLINNEVADRKAAITAVSNSASANALAITAETKRATEAENAEAKRASEAEGALQQYIGQVVFDSERDLAAEVKTRTEQFGALDGGLTAEAKDRADEDAKLSARIDFITHNTNPSAIDSLSEIVAQFSTNGQGYAQRLTYLEGVIAALVNQSQ